MNWLGFFEFYHISSIFHARKDRVFSPKGKRFLDNTIFQTLKKFCRAACNVTCHSRENLIEIMKFLFPRLWWSSVERNSVFLNHCSSCTENGWRLEFGYSSSIFHFLHMASEEHAQLSVCNPPHGIVWHLILTSHLQ